MQQGFYDTVGANAGERYSEMYNRFSSFWQPHLLANRAFVLESARKVPNDSSVVVLGAGAAYDIPLAELAGQFRAVHLLDIDEKGLQSAASSLPEQAGRIHCHVQDITGGRLAKLIQDGLSLVEQASDFDAACSALVRLYEAYDDSPPNAVLKEMISDLVISSGLSSQFRSLLGGALREVIRRRFAGQKISPQTQTLYQQAFDKLRQRLIEQHAATLKGMVAEKGLVFWADTVCESPFWGQIPANEMAAVTQAIKNTATDPEWKLPHQWVFAIQNAPTMWDVLRLLSQIVQLNVLNVEQALQWIDQIRVSVEDHTTHAIASVIPEAFESYIGNDLRLIQRKTWRWALKPIELASMKVDACLFASDVG